MKDLDYVDRYTPFFEGQLHEVIDRLTYTPYTAKDTHYQADWLHLGTLALLRQDNGWFHVHMTEELARMMQKRSIFDASPANAYQEHALELSNGDAGLCLCVKFAKVSGSYNLMKLDPAELTRLLDAAKAVGEVPVQPRPTPEQAAAVRRFAEQYGGRWKAELHICWRNAGYPRSPEADRPLLQQVRNQFGPLWLEGVTLDQLKED